MDVKTHWNSLQSTLNSATVFKLLAMFLSPHRLSILPASILAKFLVWPQNNLLFFLFFKAPSTILSLNDQDVMGTCSEAWQWKFLFFEQKSPYCQNSNWFINVASELQNRAFCFSLVLAFLKSYFCMEYYYFAVFGFWTNCCWWKNSNSCK